MELEIQFVNIQSSIANIIAKKKHSPSPTSSEISHFIALKYLVIRKNNNVHQPNNFPAYLVPSKSDTDPLDLELRELMGDMNR